MLSALVTMALLATSLEQATAAYQQGRFTEVMPAVDRLLEGPLTPRERVLAIELRAKTQVAFGDFGAAVSTFRQLLALDPDYDLAETEAPKLRSILAHARQLELDKAAARAPSLEPASPSPASPEPPRAAHPAPEALAAAVASPVAVTAPAPLYTRWWLWAAVGAVAAGTAAAVAVAATPRWPHGNLPSTELK